MIQQRTDHLIRGSDFNGLSLLYLLAFTEGFSQQSLQSIAGRRQNDAVATVGLTITTFQGDITSSERSFTSEKSPVKTTVKTNELKVCLMVFFAWLRIYQYLSILSSPPSHINDLAATSRASVAWGHFEALAVPSGEASWPGDTESCVQKIIPRFYPLNDTDFVRLIVAIVGTNIGQYGGDWQGMVARELNADQIYRLQMVLFDGNIGPLSRFVVTCAGIMCACGVISLILHIFGWNCRLCSRWLLRKHPMFFLKKTCDVTTCAWHSPKKIGAADSARRQGGFCSSMSVVNNKDDNEWSVEPCLSIPIWVSEVLRLLLYWILVDMIIAA